MNRFTLRDVTSVAYLLVYIGASPNIFAGNTIVLLFFFLYGITIAIESRQKFDAVILVPILLFAAINFLSILKWGGFSIEFISNYVGYNIRFLTAYFFLKYVIANFFSFYDKTMYVLALISVPFWLIQLFDFSFFHDYLDFINLTVDGDPRERWSFLIYTAYPSWVTEGILRNSGFTSEPSYFGFMLSFWICLRLMRNNIKIDRKMWIMIIIGLSTLSTTYLISLIIIFTFVVFNQQKLTYKILNILGVIVFLFSFHTSSFGIKKISMIIDDVKTKELADYDFLIEGQNVSRIPNFIVAKNNFLRWPFGYGLNDNGLLKTKNGVIIKGSGALLNNCIYWGIFFLIFFPLLILRFWKALKHNLSMMSKFLLFILTCAWLFSSIELKDPLFFMIICIGLIQYVPISIPIFIGKRIKTIQLRYKSGYHLNIFTYLQRYKRHENIIDC